MNDDKIQCPGCERHIVPRLITNYGVPQRSVCPFCAATVKNHGFAHVVLESVFKPMLNPAGKPIGNYLARVGRRWDKLYGNKATADAPSKPAKAEKIAGVAGAAVGVAAAAFFTGDDGPNDAGDISEGPIYISKGERAYLESGTWTPEGLDHYITFVENDPAWWP